MTAIRKPFVMYAGFVYLILLCWVSAPSAAAAEERHVFSEGETTTELSNGTVAEVNNNTSSSITLLSNGQSQYTAAVTDGQAAAIEEVVVNEQQYYVVEYRINGSSQALYYDVLKQEDNRITQIYQSGTYDRARLVIEASGEITLSYPVFNEGDAMAMPSEVVESVYQINGTQVEETEEPSAQKLSSAGTAQQMMLFTASSASYSNPSYAEISQKLTEAAREYNVPAEIVKAIAFRESGWKQYWTGDTPSYQDSCDIADGSNVVIGYDCIGIGIMQVSDYSKNDTEEINRLMHDIDYNIERGMEILKQKWNEATAKAESGLPYNLIPVVNDGDPSKLENWYFAILAYNGRLERNDPILNPQTAYQELVYKEMEEQSLVDTAPFPTHLLETGRISGKNGSYFSFMTNQIDTLGPVRESSQSYLTNDTVYVTADSLNMRSKPNGTVTDSLKRGEKLTITGNYTTNNSNVSQYVWYPVKTSSGKTGYVASGYLSEAPVVVHNLEGERRNATSASIANYGWHNETAQSVVIGRSDLPIDAFTGSVLAAQLDSPLLLTDQDSLEQVTITEMERLKPSTVYIVGAEPAVSANVENQLNSMFGSQNVIRVAGTNRYATAVQVAEEVRDAAIESDEIFLAVGDENSPDALTIGPYAGSKGIPILLTRKETLHEQVKSYISAHDINKVTIIGSSQAISDTVVSQLRKLGVAVERVYGMDRYSTNTAVIEKYYGDNPDQLFLANGQTTVDSLSGAPLAARYNAPILLTRPDAIAKPTRAFLNALSEQPELFYLGSTKAITSTTRNEIEGLLQ